MVRQMSNDEPFLKYHPEYYGPYRRYGGFSSCSHRRSRGVFANKERFPEARRIYIIDDFSYALESLDIDSDSFIIVLARGRKYDRIVLEQEIKTAAGYIGMISSRTSEMPSIRL